MPDEPKPAVPPETNVEAPGKPVTPPVVPPKAPEKPKAKKKKEPEPEPVVAPKPTTAEALRVYSLLTNIKKDVELLAGLVEAPPVLSKVVKELWAAARDACPLVK